MLLILLTIILGFVARPAADRGRWQSNLGASENSRGAVANRALFGSDRLGRGFVHRAALHAVATSRAQGQQGEHGRDEQLCERHRRTPGRDHVLRRNVFVPNDPRQRLLTQGSTHAAEYAAQVASHQSIPRMLFFTASGATLIVLLAFVRMRPDFLLRMISYFKQPSRRSLRADRRGQCPLVWSAADREQRIPFGRLAEYRVGRRSQAELRLARTGDGSQRCGAARLGVAHGHRQTVGRSTRSGGKFSSWCKSNS